MPKNIKNFGSNINLLILFFILFTFATFISPAFLDFNNIIISFTPKTFDELQNVA